MTGSAAIGLAEAEEAAARLGLYRNGLREEDRRIIALLLSERRPMGLDAIATSLGLDPRTLKQVQEPYLVLSGFITRGRRGRAATEKARAHYGRPRVLAS